MLLKRRMLNGTGAVGNLFFIAPNVLQISEGTNSVGFSDGIWAFAYVLLGDALSRI
jgi:hypothetical protein